MSFTTDSSLKEFAVYEIETDLVDYEQLGSKQKFWFWYIYEGSEKEKTLFKRSRENTGEHWSEKAAEQLAHALDMPHADYEIAEVNGHIGVISKNLVAEGDRMVMGNELLHRNSPTYPGPGPGHSRVSEHTVERVLQCLDEHIESPKTHVNIENLNSGDIFCGYLMLDTLISNQDRHHENWAILVDAETSKKYLCPTYDHAASLGRELLDSEKKERQDTKDTNRTIRSFVTKAKSELFKTSEDKRPMLTIDAFFEAAAQRNSAKSHWLKKLNSLSEHTIRGIFNRIPERIISDISREFAIKMVIENKCRLLEHEKV